ncbi:MAG: geranylgeranylglycerol-phosphate geranylgeranyltransferase [Chitinophagaceae bacterium]|nr:geranylgeranylglycerol-phosphate geranylgeranyltransferase [Chitinophagaceae bacterium]
MKTTQAVFTLIRLPNLLFIALTQVMVYFFIVKPTVLHTGANQHLDFWPFCLLVFSTVCIAAAGYMINDYFDIGIDAINKPHRVTIEKVFKRRSIIIAHILLNIWALLLAVWAALQCGSIRFIWIQILSILLLTVYSSTFKRKLIIGNLSIAVLTALTVLSIGVYEPGFKSFHPTEYHVKLLWVYIVFAFLITLIREMVKDIEDVKGDSSSGCTTLPLVWGIDRTRSLIVILVLLLFIIMGMVIWQFRSNQLLILYFTLAVCSPLLLISFFLYRARISKDYRLLSRWIKWVTLTGILSMLFI